MKFVTSAYRTVVVFLFLVNIPFNSAIDSGSWLSFIMHCLCVLSFFQLSQPLLVYVKHFSQMESFLATYILRSTLHTQANYGWQNHTDSHGLFCKGM